MVKYITFALCLFSILLCIEKITILTLDIDKEKDEFLEFYKLIGLENSSADEFKKIEYTMFGDVPGEGDVIKYFPKDPQFGPEIITITFKKLRSTKDINPNFLSSTLDRTLITLINEKGKVYYVSGENEFNQADTLTIKFNSVEKTIHKFNVSDNIINNLRKGTLVMNIRAIQEDNTILINPYNNPFTSKSVVHYDTVFTLKRPRSISNIKLQDTPELFNANEIIFSNSVRTLSEEEYVKYNMDTGEEIIETMFTADTDTLPRYCIFSKDSLISKYIYDPFTNEKFGIISGKEEKIGGKYIYGFNYRIKYYSLLDSKGDSTDVFIEEDFTDSLTTVAKEGSEAEKVNKISKFIIPGLSLTLLTFF